MSDDQFTHLIEYMNQQFDIVNKKLDQTASKESVNKLASAVDKLVRHIDNRNIAIIANDNQFARVKQSF